jgi:hypothetical protein
LPQYADKLNTYFQPAILGEIAFMLWLVIKGGKPPQMDAAARYPEIRRQYFPSCQQSAAAAG